MPVIIDVKVVYRLDEQLVQVFLLPPKKKISNFNFLARISMSFDVVDNVSWITCPPFR